MTRRFLLACLIALLAACGAGPAAVPPGAPLDHRLYVTSNNWHTRIVVATRDIPDGLLPEADTFPAANWLAIGWGEHEYYPMPDPPPRLAVKAALLPSDSVIHLIPMSAPPRSAEGFEVVEVAVSEAGLLAMLEAIDAAVERVGQAPAPVAAPGLYDGSLFFPARGRFHLFNTCNTWIARKLGTAGLPVSATGVITAENLMRQVRTLKTARPATG
jgi:uncharacterized protein (TIGR02117 family)